MKTIQVDMYDFLEELEGDAEIMVQASDSHEPFTVEDLIFDYWWAYDGYALREVFERCQASESSFNHGKVKAYMIDEYGRVTDTDQVANDVCRMLGLPLYKDES